MYRACAAAFALLLTGCHDWDALSSRHASCAPVGPSTCPDGVALCEGFEGAAPGSSWSFVAPTAATVTLDDDCAYRGKQSQHVHLDAVGAGGTAVGGIYESKVDPTAATRFVRSFLYFADPAPVSALRLFAVSQNIAPPNMTIAVKLAGNALSIGGATSGTNTAFPTEQWVCVEWAIGLGSPGTLDLYMNDAPDPISVASMDTTATVPLSRITLGSSGYASVVGDEPAHDFWIDEVIVDVQRVGCTR
jgi:hypothetical protein